MRHRFIPEKVYAHESWHSVFNSDNELQDYNGFSILIGQNVMIFFFFGEERLS